jgi:hypothetical protein
VQLMAPLGGVERPRRVVRFARRERGLSQHELAQRATLPLETLQAIESGTRLPTKQEFALLAGGLELCSQKWPHNWSTYGVARAAETPVSTAVRSRSMVRMGPLLLLDRAMPHDQDTRVSRQCG